MLAWNESAERIWYVIWKLTWFCMRELVKNKNKRIEQLGASETTSSILCCVRLLQSICTAIDSSFIVFSSRKWYFGILDFGQPVFLFVSIIGHSLTFVEIYMMILKLLIRLRALCDYIFSKTLFAIELFWQPYGRLH